MPAIVLGLAVGLLAAGGATANPSAVTSKESQAQQVLGQINSIDHSLGRAVEAYNGATYKLSQIEGQQRRNRLDLRVARQNLGRAQSALAARIVALYTSDRQGSATLDVLLGASSLDNLMSRLDAANRVSGQDARVVGEVTAFKHLVQRKEGQLRTAHSEQARAVATRATQRTQIQAQLAQRQQLLTSIRGEIAQLRAQEQARQLAAARVARARNVVQQARAALAPPPAIAAAAPSDPATSTASSTASTPAPAAATPAAPPSQYGGVVGIALKYLGVPYVWGGASPSGFDCSGFIMYVYAQVGVSLPHFTGAQYAMGVAVSKDQLQPGDLVFFDGLGHAGIYIGGGQFVHSPHTGDVVKVSSLSDSWYASTYVGARRIT